MQVRRTALWAMVGLCALSFRVLTPCVAQSSASGSKSVSTQTDSNKQLVANILNGPATWVLLVGISKYQSAQIASLNFPSIDVTAIRDSLVDPKLGGVPSDHVRLLTDAAATGANIKGSVAQFLKPNVKSGDRVIVFLAGHGVTKGFGADAKGYLLPTDVKGLTTAALEASAVDLRALSNELGQLPAAQFVVFVDACREDPTPGRGVKGNTLSDVMSRSMQVLSDDTARPVSSVTFFACGVGQRAYEDPHLKHGIFTYWILDAIKDGAVPQPDGTVDMGHLSSYVTNKVQDWCKASSQNGDFEIDQTPEMITREPTAPVVLMQVKRKVGAAAIQPLPPRLIIDTYPEGAQVTVNGQSVGSGTVTHLLNAPGSYTVKADAPGYSSAERIVQAFPGYGEQVVVCLQPSTHNSTAVTNNVVSVPDTFKRALDAETREQWEIAEPGYQATIQSSPTFGPAYERLSELQRRQGRIGDSVATLLTMVAQMPATAHADSLLSAAYTLFAEQGPGTSTSITAPTNSGNFTYPKSRVDATELAKNAAEAALKLEPASAEAERALGLALIAGDVNGNNSASARSALGKAAYLDPNNAANQYALGYGIRFFCQNIPNPVVRRDELQRAISALKEAIRLRPGDYDSHRELAFTYHLLDDTDHAMHEYELANANRGKATDGNDVAGINCAMAVIVNQKAEKSTGLKKIKYLATAAGYWLDALDIAPDLKKAMSILNSAGLSTRIANYVPAQMREVLALPKAMADNIRNMHLPTQIPKISMPTMPKLPSNIKNPIHRRFKWQRSPSICMQAWAILIFHGFPRIGRGTERFA